MAVKIITDGSSDIPRELAGEVDITVVPLTVAFNKKVHLIPGAIGGLVIEGNS